MKSILVTGVNGFVGHHLAKELNSQGYEVFGTGMEQNLKNTLKPVVAKYFGNCDLTNIESLDKIPFDDICAVINLAGLAGVGASYQQRDKYMRINIEVHTKLVERIVSQNLQNKIRVVAVSTGAVYDSFQPMPLTESSKLNSEGSPYAQSKISMEEGLKTYISKGVDIIIARPFNHIGPGQQNGFLVPDLIDQISKINTVTVGSLKTKRDYTDVRDVVRAYAMLATQKNLSHNLYNICSGKSISGTTILQKIIDWYNKPDIEIKIDKSKMRPNDPTELYGSYERLYLDTGWQPQINIDQTLKDIIQDS